MTRLIIIIGAIMFLSPFKSFSTHIVGGDVIYDCLGYSQDSSFVTVRLKFTLYRDLFSGGAQFDDDATFGVWSGSGNNWNNIDIIVRDYQDRSDVPFEDNPCVDIPSGVGVERAVYEFDVDLPLNGQDFIIAYQRCCRNPTINNLINPGDTGAAFQIEINAEAVAACNNSPRFSNFPPIFICANSDINFNHVATDPEGDVLVYEFCAPLQAGGTDGSNGQGNANDCTGVTPAPNMCGPNFDSVDFAPPFTENNPLGGDPIVEIDATTGLISGSPTTVGQYVVGVCVKEFRDGILLGEIRRDFQFNVTMCSPLVFASIDAGEVVAADLTYNIASCGENTVDIINSSYQESSIVSYDWWFELTPGDTTRFDTRDVSVTFPDLGDYEGRMILNKGTECADTANVIVNIFPSIDTDFDFDFDICDAGPIDFQDNTVTGAPAVTDWIWDFNGIDTSNFQNPSHRFAEPGLQLVTLTAMDSNGCTDSKQEEVMWYPAPPFLVVEPTKFLACAPNGEISFVNLSEPINDEYTINWNFGDGNTDTLISPVHIYEDPGVYSVELEITSPIGCSITESYPNWIRIDESPIADFVFSPDEPTVFNNDVDFTDLSIDSESQQWNFNDEFISLEQNPSYTFQDTGLYEIRLIAFHASGCPDTLIKTIDFEPVVDYFLPNAFTPNGDGENDSFIGKGVISGLRDFEIGIWNRWGEQVYASNDPYRGWNGRKQNNGEMSPQGVYVWQLKYVGPRGADKSLKGHVTLLR